MVHLFKLAGEWIIDKGHLTTAALRDKTNKSSKKVASLRHEHVYVLIYGKSRLSCDQSNNSSFYRLYKTSLQIYLL